MPPSPFANRDPAPVVLDCTRPIPRVFQENPGAALSSPGKCGLLTTMGLLLLLGGCWSAPEPDDTPQEKTPSAQQQEEEKDKAPIQLQRWSTLPAELTRLDSFYKEGHWGAAIVEAVSRREDLPQGRLISEPVTLFGSPYQLVLSRPVALAKGNPKRLEVPVFLTKLPAPARDVALEQQQAFQQTISVTWRLEDRRSETTLVSVTNSFNRRRRHQFHVVVLASDPAGYNFLQNMRWVEPIPPSFLTGDVTSLVYQLILPPAGRYVPLPSHPLAWTGIAYLFWDGIDPDNFTPAQQEALIDWLHWGGQLIVVAPSSMIRLQNSFLGPYLPADSDRLITVPAQEMQTLNRWSLQQQQGAPLPLIRPWTLARLIPRDSPQVHVALVSAEQKLPLVVQRRVGRGRICVVAFSLTQPELHPKRWPQVDHFYNSCLLRLPGREFLRLKDSDAIPEDLQAPFQRAFRVPETLVEGERTIFQRWTDGKPLYWARRFTQLRFFARDSLDDETWNRSAEGIEASVGADPLACPDFSTLLAVRWGNDPGVVLGTQLQDIPKGTAAHQAREALRHGSGIVVPRREFVLAFLVVYLVVLVPLNWTVFRLLGRVEWAWWAAVPITLVAAGTVIRMAQLNIGFARSRSEVVLVEVQPQAPRMHVTRFTALYASLGTSFQVAFDDPRSAALPLPDPQAGEVSRLTARFGLASSHRVHFYWDGSTCRLEDFFVPSNSLGMLRCEQVRPCPGYVVQQVQGNQRVLRNQTPWSFGGGVLLTPGGGRVLPGPLPAGATLRLPRDQQFTWEELQEQLPRTLPLQQIDLASLLRLACLWHFREPDAVRLVLWGDEAPGGMNISPSVSQTRQAVLYLFHLDYGPLAPAHRDRNPVPRLRLSSSQESPNAPTAPQSAPP